MKIKDLKPGDVLLCCPDPKSKIAKMIVAITKGKVSHAAIFMGERDGELYITHSEAHGIVYMSLKEFIAHEPAGFYVMRHNEQTDLLPVLEAANKYVNEKIPYPYTNLALLGLLILLNRFSFNTRVQRAFYEAVVVVAAKLMKMIRKEVRHGKETMICSQYAAQCYTDAGDDYDIKFNKLLLEFGGAKKSGTDMSLFDLLNSRNEGDLQLLGEHESDAFLANEEQIFGNFIQLMDGEENLPLTSDNNITEGKLIEASASLMMSLCYFFTGKEPDSIEQAKQIIEEFSTNRNFFVTPDDLLSNTKNLNEKGFFDSKRR